MSVLRKPEIMSPAGYWPQLRAAIEAGADSVYFGLKHFTARAKVGFSLEELPEAMATLHRRGVKGFVTFNTLVFDHELAEAARTLAAIAEAGADAIIVQDLGVLKMAKAIAPDLEIHGSTQMSITSADGVRLAQSLGASRVTLARELSLDEIRAIRAATDCELEIFVHGALCVAYSGQCFSSEAWGGRSANRGQCAQACRLPYEMIVDGKLLPLADARYLLSPGDLYALRADSGDRADRHFGAENRRPLQGRGLCSAHHARLSPGGGRSLGRHGTEHRPRAELQLEQVYSRGLGPYFLTGTNHQAVVDGRAPRHRGVLMGRVVRIGDGARSPSIRRRRNDIAPLKAGDGIVFDAAGWRSPEEREEGGRVFQVIRREGTLELAFGNGAVDLSRIRRGDLVWRTHDPDLDKVGAALSSTPPRPCASSSHVACDRARRRSAGDRMARRRNESQWCESRRRRWCARTESRARPGISCGSNSGGWETRRTSWRQWSWKCEGAPFAPSSLLNQVRREAVETAAGAARRRRASRRPSAVPVAIARRSPAGGHEYRRRSCICWFARPSNWTPPLPSARQHHARLPGSLRPEAFARTREGGRDRRRGWPVRACSNRAKNASPISC